MRLLLIVGGAIAAVGLFLLATASGETPLLARHYSLLFGLNAVLAILLAGLLAYQLAVLISVYCAIHALGVSVPNGAVLAFLPAVAAAQALPISLSGLGIREGLLVILLHPLGVPTGKAVGIGLLWYAMTLVVSLLGAPAFAVGQRHDDSSSPVDEAPPVDADAATSAPTTS